MASSQNKASAFVIHTEPADTTAIVWHLKDTLANYPSLTLPPDQVFRVYVGLKQRDEYKKRLTASIAAANQLNAIIQDRNDSLQATNIKIMDLNSDISDAQDLAAKQAVDIQRLQDKKTPWYLHPVTYAVLGFLGGAYLFSR